MTKERGIYGFPLYVEIEMFSLSIIRLSSSFFCSSVNEDTRFM